MELGSRTIMQVNVTEHPTLAWVRQQTRDARFGKQPEFLIRDNDGTYGQPGKRVTTEVDGEKISCRSTFDLWPAQPRGIRGIPTPYHAPNAQAHMERFNGTLHGRLVARPVLGGLHHDCRVAA